MPTNTESDFWKKVMPSSGDCCWTWIGSCDADGYGTIMLNYIQWRTHRLAYHLSIGPIPPGMGVLHSCDNPPCCNPSHLRIGTNLDNMRDRSKRGRHRNQKKESCPLGHPYSGKNLRIDTVGARRCRTCDARIKKARYDKTYVKTGYIHGEQSNLSKLTSANVSEIRSLVASGQTYSHVADKFEIDRTHVWRIITKRAWAKD